MHPLGGSVNRVERTLLNFFSRLCVRSGFFGALEGCFAGDFEVAARRVWAVLPRNSGVFSLTGVRRGDSAHGGHGRANWAKNFLKIFIKGAETPKSGVREGGLEGGLGTPYIGCAR